MGLNVFPSFICYSDTAIDDKECYVAYYEATNLMFRKSTDRGQNWEAPVTVDSTDDVGQYCSMTVKRATNPNMIEIAYYDATNKDLKYVSFNENETSLFFPVVVDDSGDVGKYCQMTWTSTPSEKRCIAYYDETNGNLKVAKKGTGSWYCEPVDNSANDVGAYCSITCNSSGDFFMAYADTTASGVKRAYASNISVTGPTTWTKGSYAYTAAVEYTGIALNGANGIICFRGGNTLNVLRTTNSFATVGSLATIDSSSGAGESARLRYSTTNAAFWISYNRNYVSIPLGSHQTKLARSADSGATWTLMTVANSSGALGAMRAASCEIDGARVYMTYGFWSGAVAFLRLSKSTDGGTTW